MIIKRVHVVAIIAACAAAVASPVEGAPIIFSAAGGDPTSIQSAVDAFRAALGDPNNGGTPGSQPGGRREITWDGGGAAAPATVFADPMTVFAARGNVFTSPGGQTEISGAPNPEFGDINPTYPDIFQTFSSPRLFAPLNSNITDVLITVPGTTNVQAFTSGYGVVFTDVDLANTTGLEFFDPLGQSLGTFYAPTANNGLSFLGVSFGKSIVSRVRITTGNTALGPNDGGAVDVVATDDFIYGEPQEQADVVPEPATLLLMGMGLAAAATRRRNTRA